MPQAPTLRAPKIEAGLPVWSWHDHLPLEASPTIVYRSLLTQLASAPWRTIHVVLCANDHLCQNVLTATMCISAMVYSLLACHWTRLDLFYFRDNSRAPWMRCFASTAMRWIDTPVGGTECQLRTRAWILIILRIRGNSSLKRGFSWNSR